MMCFMLMANLYSVVAMKRCVFWLQCVSEELNIYGKFFEQSPRVHSLSENETMTIGNVK